MYDKTLTQQLILLFCGLFAIPALIFASFYIENLALNNLLAEQNPVVFKVQLTSGLYSVTFAMLIALSFNLSKVLLSAYIAWQYQADQPYLLGVVAKGLLVLFSMFATLFMVAEQLTSPNLESAYQLKLSRIDREVAQEREQTLSDYQSRLQLLEGRETRDLETAKESYRAVIEAAAAGMKKESNIGGSAAIGPRYRAHEKLHGENQTKRDAALFDIRQTYVQLYQQLHSSKAKMLNQINQRHQERRNAVSKQGTLRDHDARHNGVVMLAVFLSDILASPVSVEVVIGVFAMLLCLTIEILPIALCGYTFAHLLSSKSGARNAQYSSKDEESADVVTSERSVRRDSRKHINISELAEIGSRRVYVGKH